MTDKPEIKVGQRWVTRAGNIVRVLATNGLTPRSAIIQDDDGVLSTRWPDGSYNSGVLDPGDLISLAPSTVKREVALYRDGSSVDIFEVQDERSMDLDEGWRRISEPLTIEFTLLPGESVE